MEYIVSEAMFDQAEMYRNTVHALAARETFNSSIVVLNELALECYISSIIEGLTGKSMEDIYGKGCIPHDLFALYNDMHRYDTKHELPRFDRNLRRELQSAFRDYQASRFPKPGNYRVVNEESISFNISLANEIQEMAEEYQKHRQQQIERE